MDANTGPAAPPPVPAEDPCYFQFSQVVFKLTGLRCHGRRRRPCSFVASPCRGPRVTCPPFSSLGKQFLNWQGSDAMDLSDIATDDSPPHRKLKVEAGKVLKTVTTTVMGPAGEPVLVEFELRQGPPGAPGMPQELFEDLLHADGAAAAQGSGIGRPMAEAMAANAVGAASSERGAEDPPPPRPEPEAARVGPGAPKSLNSPSGIFSCCWKRRSRDAGS